MSTTTITTIVGCIFAAATAAQGVPGVDTIPYARIILGLLSAVSGAIFAYFTKGRGDSGKV